MQDDWNEKAVAALKEKGPDGIDPTTMYQASKVLAERAIIDFVEKHKGEIGWDATRFVPGWVSPPLTPILFPSSHSFSRIDLRRKFPPLPD